MLKKGGLFLVGFILSLSSYGQGETNNWYFGQGAGIQFNTDGSVTTVTDGKINTIEGCSTISDTSGNLLFYTDGITVYNRNHEVMENGRGLYGDPSSTQSAIIVPKPEDPNIQYIFTVDTSIGGDPDRGLNYSIVDLTLNNGNGAVIQKNINLLKDCSEKVTAVVKSCFDRSIWVVTLASENGDTAFFNTYHAFEVNPTGVNTIAIKTTFPKIIEDHRGYLKFSIDGSKLASANASSGLYLYNFDTSTGIVSNQQEIVITNADQFSYGIEFSPSQQFLYVLTTNSKPPGQTNDHIASLLQYNITAPNIAATEVVLDNRNLYRGAIQLGANGKIYRTIAEDYSKGTPYLGVINNPNEQGIAADYQHDAISLNGKNGMQGLPPFVQSFFDKSDLVKKTDGTKTNSLSICESESFLLETNLISGATYAWKKDGISFVNNTHRYEILNSTISNTGRYTVETFMADPDECPLLSEATITVSPLPTSETLALTQCDTDNNSNDGIAQFMFDELELSEDFTYSFYTSIINRDNDNAINNLDPFTNTITFNQTIYYKMVNNAGCKDYGELHLKVQSIILNPIPEYTFQTCDITNDDNFLDGIFDIETIKQFFNPLKQVAFYSTLDDVTLENNPLSNSFRTESTIIYARIENDGQCETVEQIELLVNPLPLFKLANTFLWCTDGEPLSVNAPDGFDIYIWSKTEGNNSIEVATTQSTLITETGNYTLEVGYTYNNGNGTTKCISSENFEVTPSNIARINEILIQDLSKRNTIEILVSGDGNYEYSIDGDVYQDSNYFDNVESGFLTVYVKDKNDCGISEKEISVIGYPKVFTPNGDSINEKWQILGINSHFQAGSVIVIYDRYGQLIAQVSTSSEGWDGTFNGQQLPESDYWFKVNLENGKIFKGHFSLKR